MLSPKEIKARIKGIKNIQQITRTMQMVAVAKLKKTQTKAIASRPYEYKLQELFKVVKQAVKPSDEGSHLLFKKREVRKIGILIISSDQGLCGSYNTNIFNHVLSFIKSNSDKEINISVIGKKGYNFFKRRNYAIRDYYPQAYFKDLSSGPVEEIVNKLIQNFEKEESDEIQLFFTRFDTVMRSIPSSVKLFPLEEGVKEKESGLEYLFEPEADKIIEFLLPKYFKLQVYKALIESIASEQAARMISMRSATDNAEEMLGELVLTYNKARQSSITKELLEVASGAEALKKVGGRK